MNVPFGHLLSKVTNHEEDGVHFCGLLRKAELYVFVSIVSDLHISSCSQVFWLLLQLLKHNSGRISI